MKSSRLETFAVFKRLSLGKSKSATKEQRKNRETSAPGDQNRGATRFRFEVDRIGRG